MSILKIKDLVHKYVTYGDTEEDKQEMQQSIILISMLRKVEFVRQFLERMVPGNHRLRSTSMDF